MPNTENDTSWDNLSIDGKQPYQPKGDLLRVEIKLDQVIKMLNVIHAELRPHNKAKTSF